MTSRAVVPPAAMAAISVCVATHRALSPAMTTSATFLAVVSAACAACLAWCITLAALVCAVAALALLAAEALVLGSGAGRGFAFCRVVT